MNRTILHIDFDSFFASVEQQYNSSLRGMPIGVTATNGRTCIIASSREAKRLEIKTGDRTWESLPKCPDLILIPADFNKYFEISKKFLNICKDYSPYVEMFSLDELFLDVTSTQHLFDGPYKIIEKIKERIKNEIGECITVSIGISHNKLLAKLASGLKKPNGVFEINSKNFEEVYKNAKLTDLCGIGDRIAIRLNKIGVYSLMDLRNIKIELLEKEFGKVYSNVLKNIRMGIDDSSVIPFTEAPQVKSVGRNYCLPKNEYNKRIVLQNIFELCEEIGIKLRRLNKKGRTVGINISGSIDIGKRRSFCEFVDSGSEIFERCKIILSEESFFKEKKLVHKDTSFALVRQNASSALVRQNASSALVRQNASSAYYCRQISIWVSNLQDSKNLTPSLFPENEKNNNLSATIDNINDKFGDHTIRNGFLLYADKLTTVPNGFTSQANFGDTYERTKLARPNFSFEKE